MIEHGDMTYLELSRVVRWMDRSVRKGIYKDFMDYIQTFLDGDDVMIHIDVLLQTRSNTTNFVYSKSYLGMWLKKLSAEWSQLSTQQVFENNARFIEWIRDADDHVSDPQKMDETEPADIISALSQMNVIPFEIESSGRARRWIANQMHLLQVCPSAALPDHEIVDWCQIIRKNHPDVVQVVSIVYASDLIRSLRIKWILETSLVDSNPDIGIGEASYPILPDQFRVVQYLLEMLCHIRAMNLGRAAESLRIYFDYSMFRASDSSMTATLRGCRLGVLDQRSLRFSCLLQARLCRIFGDRQAARLLLGECVQQAQNHDVACLRMAMVELAALEAMPPNDTDSRTFTSEEKPVDNLLTTEELLRMINRASESETRVRLRHGLALAAQSVATSLVETNYADGCAPRHETEAHAIAGVNMVYAAAMMGEWDRVNVMLGRLKSFYSPELNCQAAQYVTLCDRIILFDSTILRGQWDKCVPILEEIEALDAAEAALRRAILLAARCELTSARNVLETLYPKYESPSTVFIHMRLRLQLAMLLSTECRWSAAIQMLKGVREEALAIEQRNISAMALRRIGVVQMLSGDYASALKSLIECQKDVNSTCSILEKAILSIALAEAHSKAGSRHEHLRFLNRARVQCRQAGAVLFEKCVLQEIALYYHERGDMDERDEIAEEFAAIDERFSGHFDWQLV
ncbi:unnamed protein product [Heligmosomoides polygyrus]|uniref:Anaphase-promoting complex subunit 5 n=1 Tax=Heligmosomoides polygyrus TaxID=6339 RepID=A0A3P7ZVX8_HELPZ|nr:unnamed protein product [Heligmosomoides polygyrus]